MKDIWIGVIGVLVGALIGILGQIIGNLINHKKEIEKIRNEYVLKEKIESFKKIHKIINEIKRRTINFLIKTEKNNAPIKELILELNNEFFLFSNKQTLIEAREGVNSMTSILDNPPEIVKIKGKKMDINQEELKRAIKQISDAQIKIITSIRKELKI